MASIKESADALRAVADLIEWANTAFWRFGDPEVKLPACWKSQGFAGRIVAGMTDVTTEPYDSETTHYLIYRGRLLGQVVEVMESQDD